MAGVPTWMEGWVARIIACPSENPHPGPLPEGEGELDVRRIRRCIRLFESETIQLAGGAEVDFSVD